MLKPNLYGRKMTVNLLNDYDWKPNPGSIMASEKKKVEGLMVSSLVMGILMIALTTSSTMSLIDKSANDLESDGTVGG